MCGTFGAQRVQRLRYPPQLAAACSLSGVSVRSQAVWKLRSRTLALGERTLLMAIVNLTPDSFSGDGLLRSAKGLEALHVAGVAAAFRALKEGADIVDLGAESTRPGAQPISAEEEQARLLPVVEAVVRARPEAVVSVDTYHARTARAAAERGAEILNDVSGMTWDASMAASVKDTGCGLVLMHTRGRPGEWDSQPRLAAGEAPALVREGLRAQLAEARAAGIADNAIVLDPGFGFGKVGRENFELLAGLPELAELGRPLLIGLSRKGFLGEAVAGLRVKDEPAAESRRAATLAANVAAVLSGASLLRVHDVRLTREAVAVADAVLAAKTAS